jgi:hypothetical protein
MSFRKGRTQMRVFGNRVVREVKERRKLQNEEVHIDVDLLRSNAM